MVFGRVSAFLSTMPTDANARIPGTASSTRFPHLRLVSDAAGCKNPATIMSKSIELLTQLSNAHAVPGSEDEVRAIFRRELEGSGAITVDRIGNFLLRRVHSGRPHIGIDAHMDEVGFMVQSITPDGYLRILGLGGWSVATLPAQRVVVMGSKGKIPGTFGSLPPHFQKEGSASPGMEDLFIDIGADSEATVREWGIRPGSPVCPDVQVQATRHPKRLIGKAFDNRVGCAVCIETAQRTRNLNANLSFIGAVQEEGGLRGATVLSASHPVDLMIVLEGTPADDAPGMLNPTSQGVLGKGVQIRCYDPTHLANSRLVDWAICIAEQHAIPFQLAVRRSGGTNAGRYHLAAHGIPTLVLGVPARYIHSHQSMIDLDDYAATCKLAETLIRELDAATYEGILPR